MAVPAEADPSLCEAFFPLLISFPNDMMRMCKSSQGTLHVPTFARSGEGAFRETQTRFGTFSVRAAARAVRHAGPGRREAESRRSAPSGARADSRPGGARALPSEPCPRSPRWRGQRF